MKYRALIIDLDGTTIPNKADGWPTKNIVRAIKSITTTVFVSVATGRPYKHCKEIIHELGIKNPCIVNGGSEIVNPLTDKSIWKQMLTKEAISDILELVRTTDYPILSDHVSTKSRQSSIHELVGSQSLWIGPIPSENVPLIYNKISKIPRINAHVAPAWDIDGSVIQVTDELASKKHALQYLLSHTNLNHESLVAVGDSGNDIPLFEVAGVKVAMGNAQESLKKRADWIAPSVQEDGLAYVIEKYFLVNA